MWEKDENSINTWNSRFYHKYNRIVSASEFVKQTGLSKKAVTMALRGNTVRRLGKWLFTYEDSANVVRIKDLVLNPVNAWLEVKIEASNVNWMPWTDTHCTTSTWLVLSNRSVRTTVCSISIHRIRCLLIWGCPKRVWVTEWTGCMNLTMESANQKPKCS